MNKSMMMISDFNANSVMSSFAFLNMTPKKKKLSLVSWLSGPRFWA